MIQQADSEYCDAIESVRHIFHLWRKETQCDISASTLTLAVLQEHQFKIAYDEFEDAEFTDESQS